MTLPALQFRITYLLPASHNLRIVTANLVAMDLAVPAHISQSRNAVLTARRYMNYHIRVKGAVELVQYNLDSGESSFQNIWIPDINNSDIARPFKELMATLSKFQQSTGSGSPSQRNSA